MSFFYSLPLLFLLSSCQHASTDRWQCRQSISSAPPSSMTSYSPACKNPLRDHDIEIIYFCGKQQVYINLLFCPLEAPPEALFTFRYTILDMTYTGKATIFEGGQRLLVDQEDADRMIDAWCSDKEVSIKLL